jgi:transcriptional regulator with GAF, ATPase, and Fis domain
MNAVLRAISGPLQGAVFRLDHEDVSIGRHSSNHLCIGDLSVSRSHCVLRYTGTDFAVVDRGSHNGTLVNSNPANGDILRPGDQLGVGKTVFEFVTEDSDDVGEHTPVDESEVIFGSTIRPPDDLMQSPEAETSRVSSGVSSRDLMIFTKLGKILASAATAEQIELKMLDLLGEVLPAERGAIVGVQGAERVKLGWSRREGLRRSVEVDDAIVDQVLQEGKCFLQNDPAPGDSIRGGQNSRRARPVLAAPLFVRGKARAVIYLETNAPSERFTGRDLEFVATISSHLALALSHLQTLERLENENRRLRSEFALTHEMIGQSPRMREVYQRIARIAPTDATVLICGETGTGKELAARAIHLNSPRAEQTFEAINCALLNGTLLESELFGHEKGAFTGAVTQKKGKLEIADHGSVFLDEVGELPEGPQTMLLRVLQDRIFERLGGTKRIQVDIRVIAATNRDLEAAIRDRKFRDDLFYRLNVVSVSLPALKQRREDIPALTEHFLRRAKAKNKRLIEGVSSEAMSYLKAYEWPGNVRELENAIEYAVVFGSTNDIMPEDLPEKILMKTEVPGVPVTNYQDAVREAKRQIVIKALEQASGNCTKAAKLLHIHPNNLHRLIRELEVKSRAQTARG